MLQFKNLKINVGERNLFVANEVHLLKGLVALVGRNGAGKSTLLKSIMGLHDNYGGTIKLGDKQIDQYPKSELAKEIAIVYSKSSIFGSHSGRDVLLLGRLPYQNAFAKVSQSDYESVDRIIELLQLQRFIDQEFNVLSDGEKQLIMIGRAMVQDTQIILLDEPGAFLDLVNKHRLMQVLKNISTSTEKLIVFSTHDVGFLESMCESVLLIDHEELRVLEKPATFLSEIYMSFGIGKSELNEV